MLRKNVYVWECLLYNDKCNSNASETCIRICQSFGEDAINDRTARNWFQKFASGDESLDNAPRFGSPFLLHDDDLTKTIEMDLKLTCRELVAKFRSHLHLVGKRYICICICFD